MEVDGDIIRVAVVREAARDYKYLLNRGYSRYSSLSLVTSRYKLTLRERMLLYRCIHPEKHARIIRSKLLPTSRIMGRSLVIDGFNNLITVNAILRGEEVYLCDDGVLRDLSMRTGRIRVDRSLREAAKRIIDALVSLKISNVDIVLDSQVSRSGELASYIRRLLAFRGINGTARTSPRGDLAVIRTGTVVSSSDIVVLLRINEAYDLPKYIASSERTRLIDMNTLDS